MKRIDLAFQKFVLIVTLTFINIVLMMKDIFYLRNTINLYSNELINFFIQLLAPLDQQWSTYHDYFDIESSGLN